MKSPISREQRERRARLRVKEEARLHEVRVLAAKKAAETRAARKRKAEREALLLFRKRSEAAKAGWQTRRALEEEALRQERRRKAKARAEAARRKAEAEAEAEAERKRKKLQKPRKPPKPAVGGVEKKKPNEVQKPEAPKKPTKVEKPSKKPVKLKPEAPKKPTKVEKPSKKPVKLKERLYTEAELAERLKQERKRLIAELHAETLKALQEKTESAAPTYVPLPLSSLPKPKPEAAKLLEAVSTEEEGKEARLLELRQKARKKGELADPNLGIDLYADHRIAEVHYRSERIKTVVKPQNFPELSRRIEQMVSDMRARNPVGDISILFNFLSLEDEFMRSTPRYLLVQNGRPLLTESQDMMPVIVEKQAHREISDYLQKMEREMSRNPHAAMMIEKITVKSIRQKSPQEIAEQKGKSS